MHLGIAVILFITSLVEIYFSETERYWMVRYQIVKFGTDIDEYYGKWL